jgi:hypothetical protein
MANVHGRGATIIKSTPAQKQAGNSQANAGSPHQSWAEERSSRSSLNYTHVSPHPDVGSSFQSHKACTQLFQLFPRSVGLILQTHADTATPQQRIKIPGMGCADILSDQHLDAHCLGGGWGDCMGVGCSCPGSPAYRGCCWVCCGCAGDARWELLRLCLVLLRLLTLAMTDCMVTRGGSSSMASICGTRGQGHGQQE